MPRKSTPRRQVLIGAGAIVSALAVPQIGTRSARAFEATHASVASPERRCPERRCIDRLSARELADYEYAVQALRATCRSNTGDIAFHPALRNLHSPETGHFGWQTAEAGDMPWHLAHLAAFEAALQAVDPARTARVMVPYWDITRAPSGTTYPRAFERPDSPLYFRTRASATEIGAVAQQTTSSQPDAAMDPLFWSFHAYIDVVWRRWQQEQGRTAVNGTPYLVFGPSMVEVRVRGETTSQA